jgi:23S rRNA pseudouridine1911/1915/1917 synthase
MDIQESREVPDIPIIYQDHYLLVVNKPAGLVIHPTYKHADGTMWDAILAALAQQESDDWQPAELPDKPGWERAPSHIREMLREQQRLKYIREEGLLPRPCLLHRLDKDTSGIVALARTERARRHLSRQFQDHSIVKRYLAVVGRSAPGWASPRTPLKVSRLTTGGQTLEACADMLWTVDSEITIDGPLQRDQDDRRRSIVGPQGQHAITLVKTLAANDTYAMLDVRPVTGRTHQIRAHLAAAGYAIVGDKTYGLPGGEGGPEAALSRQFLHAHSLELRSYHDNTLRTFVAPLPVDLAAWLAKFFPAGMEAVYARQSIFDG